MSINRVGPSNPPEKRERDIPDEKRFKKQMTVEEVGQIDADQRKKKRERSQPAEEAPEEDYSNDTAASEYSPYQPQFFLSNSEPDLFGRNVPTDTQAQSQTYGTPQPSVIPSPPSYDDEESGQLPSSQSFWQDTDWSVPQGEEMPWSTQSMQQPQMQQGQTQQQGNQQGQQQQSSSKQAQKTGKPAPSTEGKKGKGPAKEEALPWQTKKDQGQPTPKASTPEQGPSSFPFLVKETPASKGKAPKEEIDQKTGLPISTQKAEKAVPPSKQEEPAAPQARPSKEMPTPPTQARGAKVSAMPQPKGESTKPEQKKGKEPTESTEEAPYPTFQQQVKGTVPGKQEAPVSKKGEQQKQQEPAGPAFAPEQQMPFEDRTFKRGRKEEEKEPKYGGLQSFAKSFSSVQIMDRGSGEKEGRQKGEESKVHGVQGPSSNVIPFTPEIAGNASNATTQLTPYITPEVQNLFTQMVGTIIIMTTPPGITQTQVVLNSPAFANSVFNGSVITLERYATAPDSFNIKLTGSTEAVNVFNNNLDGLATAFQKGRFKFRVGRLEASYEPTRALFRRKESAGGTGSDVGDQTKK